MKKIEIMYLPWATESVTNFNEQDIRKGQTLQFFMKSIISEEKNLLDFQKLKIKNDDRKDTLFDLSHLNARMVLDLYYLNDYTETIVFDKWKNYSYQGNYYRFNPNIINWLNKYVTVTKIGNGASELNEQIRRAQNNQ